ncbi:MAG: hypothetical protein ACE14M_10115 [Terriglobales bacterium]
MSLGEQVVWLFVLAIPIACVSWTVTHEEIFREPRDFCLRRSEDAPQLWQRKFFYVFTCEYCFSHYVTLAFLALTRYKLLYTDWRGYVLAGFALVWVANLYIAFFGQVKLGVKKERTEIKALQEDVAIKQIEKDVKQAETPNVRKPVA